MKIIQQIQESAGSWIFSHVRFFIAPDTHYCQIVTMAELFDEMVELKALTLF